MLRFDFYADNRTIKIMKQNLYKISILMILASLNIIAIQAQSNDKSNKKLSDEITAFRQKLSDAIEKRDRKTLEMMFADDFTHTHAVGKVDGKSARIDSILEGGKTLETTQQDAIEIRFYGKNTAVAVGQTTIDEAVYRWTIVYVKNKKNWQMAASQASRKV